MNNTGSDLDKYLQEIDINELIKELSSQYPAARRKAHRELVRIGDGAIQDLVILMHEPDRRLAREAVRILGEMTSPKSPHSLAVSLQDEDPLVRWDATKALANLERGGIVALLEALVKGYHSAHLRDAARDVLSMLAQNHHLISGEEKVLAVLNGSYPESEIAIAAQAALDTLKAK